jgi:hypothetical protein
VGSIPAAAPTLTSAWKLNQIPIEQAKKLEKRG